MKLPVVTYEHDGSFDWKCLACFEEGSCSYKGLVTKTENPKVSDLDELITNLEVEHALSGCNGRLSYEGGSRYRIVRHEDAA